MPLKPLIAGMANVPAGFNAAVPGPIGGTTPAAITGTTITATVGVVVPDSTSVPGVKGATSTTSGFGVNGNVSYIFANNSQVASFAVGGNSSFQPFTASNGLTLGLSGVSFAPKVGGAIFDHFTDGATTHVDGTEDTLYTDSLAAGALNSNGAKVWGNYQLAIVGHAVSTDRIRVYFGGTAIFDTTAVNFPLSSALTLLIRVIRVSASVVRCAVVVTTTTATVIPYSQYTEVTGLTLTDAQIIKLTAISTGTNSAVGDVTAKLGALYWEPAA